MHLYQVLRRPLITEKATALQANGQYAFEVAAEATKPQIKQAVEKAFKVEVTAGKVMTGGGRRRGKGRRRKLASSPWKKAVVTLKAGDKIQLFEATS